jgi:hypothetical protein
MTAFLEIARRAKAEHEARLEQAQVQADQERRRRETAIGTGIEVLRSTVLPTLLVAKAELATDGIPMVIEDNFNSMAAGGAAEVSFRLVGPEIPSKHAGRVTPESTTAFFSHDGSALCFAMGRRGARLSQNFRPVHGDPRSVIEHAIALAAASYFANFETVAPSASSHAI